MWNSVELKSSVPLTIPVKEKILCMKSDAVCSFITKIFRYSSTFGGRRGNDVTIDSVYLYADLNPLTTDLLLALLIEVCDGYLPIRLRPHSPEAQ